MTSSSFQFFFIKKRHFKNFKKSCPVLRAFRIAFTIFFFFVALSTIFFASPAKLFADPYPDVTAEAAIIMDYDTGRIFWQKNADEKLFPASTTKMMTGIVAIERIKDLNEIVRISRNASGTNNSFFALKTGDEISLLDLLKAALINSHNNATIALAEYVAGSEEEFVKLMNEKAIAIGAYNTSFQNTNGLDSNSPAHKSTAKDLAIIARYCMKNELFKNIVSTREEYITINGEKVYLFNTNILLFFDYIKGIKTGFTNNAGYCQVLYSQRNGLGLISVVLKSAEGKRESDILQMINWANNNYQNKKIIDANEVYKTVAIEKSIQSSDYSYTTRFFMELYPESDFSKLVNINDKIEITDDFPEKSTQEADISAPVSLPYDNIAEGGKAGNLRLTINENPEKNIGLVYGHNTKAPFVSVNVELENDNRLRNILIFLISFYFFIFILIMLKNLLLKEKE